MKQVVGKTRRRFLRAAKIILGLILFLMLTAFSNYAQEFTLTTTTVNTVSSRGYIDEYPVKLMKVKSVKTRLKTLLGKRYSDFDISIQVQSPMTKVGDFLLASGCMPHVCTINEAAFAIDLKNKRIHAAIYEKDRPTKYFNEDKAPTPQVLLDWVLELKKQ